MRRFIAELCHNNRWVIFLFAFVGVCFISNGLRVDKTISVGLYGTFYKKVAVVLRCVYLPWKVLRVEWHKTFL